MEWIEELICQENHHQRAVCRIAHATQQPLQGSRTRARSRDRCGRKPRKRRCGQAGRDAGVR